VAEQLAMLTAGKKKGRGGGGSGGGNGAAGAFELSALGAPSLAVEAATGDGTKANDVLDAIFSTSDMLKNLAAARGDEYNPGGGVVPYSDSELRRAVSGVLDRCPMNPSQLSALADAVTKPISLIQGASAPRAPLTLTTHGSCLPACCSHPPRRVLGVPPGPPGTGKTRTACAILATVVALKEQRLRDGGERARGQKLLRVLACAHSNIATDNLLEGLLKQGVKVVRIGRPVNVRSALWNHTLDARLQQEPEWIAARQRLEVAVGRYSTAKAGGGGGAAFGAMQRGLGDAKKSFQEVEDQCVNQVRPLPYSACPPPSLLPWASSHISPHIGPRGMGQVLLSADVIVSTCIGAGSDTLRTLTGKEDIRFSTVLVDEAAQVRAI
jgi:hypothetical protein